MTRKCDTNNDENVDTNEAVTAQKPLFKKKTLVAASGLLVLAFLGKIGLSSVYVPLAHRIATVSVSFLNGVSVYSLW